MQSRIVQIPLNKLVPSNANVRRTHRAVGVEELAANIAGLGGRLIQSLAVQPVRNPAGEVTGTYRVSAGGRRLAALKLLAKRKVIGKDAAIPCILSEDDESELSLSENVMREPLHPADQFDAFKTLSDRGQDAEAIGARFGVTAQVVRQRLRLAVVNPVLVQCYRDGELTLDQLMAFAVTQDRARQEQVHDALPANAPAYLIRRMLTETQAPARDRRAIFVGADAYTAAGGVVARDLFTEDHGGWFEDPALLDKLTMDKLEAIAAELKEREGWKWTEASTEYPNVHGMARLYPSARELPSEAQTRLDALTVKYDSLATECDGADAISDEASGEKLDALSAEIESLAALQHVFAAEDIARSGSFVVLGYDGAARIERGFVRPEDEPMGDPAGPEAGEAGGESISASHTEPSDEASIKPLSDALVRELTAHRTMALRLVLGDRPETALLAVIHALALQTFYGATSATCLDLTPRSANLGSHAVGTDDTAPGRAVAERHQTWAQQLPEAPEDLWGFVSGLDPARSLALLAHCASLTVFAVQEPWDRSHRHKAAADGLARATGLDMAQHWRATAASYFDRVTKATIIEAVREAAGDETARRMECLTKRAMADAAETALAETHWLPAILRAAGPETQPAEPDAA